MTRSETGSVGKNPDPALAHNLTFFKNEIIAKYRAFGREHSVRSVRITIGALNTDEEPKTTGKTEPETGAGP